MKKIIAAAVATAFVAPAFAADISISGVMGQYQINEKNTANDLDRTSQETAVSIKASSEGANGLGVSMTYSLNGTGGADGGENITITHAAFGKIAVGNVSSGIDAVDDKTEILESIDPLTGSADSSILWTLPTFVEGLAVNLSYAPKDGAVAQPDPGFDATADEFKMSLGMEGDSTGRADDESSVGVAYQAGPVRIAFGTGSQISQLDAREDVDVAQDVTFFGAQYKANGIMVALENTKFEQTVGGTEDEARSIAASYEFGEASLRVLNTKFEADGVDLVDYTAYGVHYNLGGGLKAIVETGSDSQGSLEHEFTTVGLKYSF